MKATVVPRCDNDSDAPILGNFTFADNRIGSKQAKKLKQAIGRIIDARSAGRLYSVIFLTSGGGNSWNLKRL
jgi:hypothetical protein